MPCRGHHECCTEMPECEWNMGGHFQHRLRISAAPLTEKQFRLRDTMVCGEVYYNCVVHYVTIIIFIIIAAIIIKIIKAVFRTV
jgi:hypothetical protein